MSRRLQATTARRIKAATSRIESQPYDFQPGRRTPRLTATSTHGWCQLGSSLNAATGTWPSITPTTTTATVYINVNGSLSSIGSKTLYNWRNVSWSANKTTLVLPNGNGTWDIDDQDC